MIFFKKVAPIALTLLQTAPGKPYVEDIITSINIGTWKRIQKRPSHLHFYASSVIRGFFFYNTYPVKKEKVIGCQKKKVGEEKRNVRKAIKKITEKELSTKQLDWDSSRRMKGFGRLSSYNKRYSIWRKAWVGIEKNVNIWYIYFKYKEKTKLSKNNPHGNHNPTQRILKMYQNIKI